MRVEDLSPAARRLYESFLKVGLSESAALASVVGHVGSPAVVETGSRTFDGMVARFRGRGLSEEAAVAATVGRASESQVREGFTVGAIDVADVARRADSLVKAGGEARSSLIVALGNYLEEAGVSRPMECARQLVEDTAAGRPATAAVASLVEAARRIAASPSSAGRRVGVRESTAVLERVRSDPAWLSEAAKVSSGRITLRLISPGMGSSGFYPSAVLEAAAMDGVFSVGTQMFWDHPSASGAMDRPERSLRDLAAVLESSARWMPNHQQGPGLYAEAKVFTPYREVVSEMAPHIGVSIRAQAEVSQQTVEGRLVRSVDRITEVASVDFVTKAGRGGQVLSMIESRRRG